MRKQKRKEFFKLIAIKVSHLVVVVFIIVKLKGRREKKRIHFFDIFCFYGRYSVSKKWSYFNRRHKVEIEEMEMKKEKERERKNCDQCDDEIAAAAIATVPAYFSFFYSSTILTFDLILYRIYYFNLKATVDSTDAIIIS